MTVEDVLRALAQKTGFEVIEHALLAPTQNGHTQYRIVGRVTGKSGQLWVGFLLHVLRIARRAPWSIDISRSYLLKDMPDGETALVYVWRLVLQDRRKEHPIEHHLPAIRQAILDYQLAPAMRTETDEVKLYGTKRNTGPGTGGGYASSVFSPVVGPAAAAIARNGR